MKTGIFIGRYKLYIPFILFFLLLFHGLNNYFVLSRSRYCLDPDEVNYFGRVNQIPQSLRNIQLNSKSLHKAFDEILGLPFKPPLFFLTAAPFLLFGIDKNNIIMSNLFYFLILLFATYGIGKKLYDYKVGILSAFIVSMFPGVFALSRVLMVDFSLAAMVTLTCYLFTLDKFDSLNFSLLTGVVIGLGSYAKHSYFIFLLPILSYFFFQEGNLKSKRTVINFIFSVILGLLIAFVYYRQLPYSSLYTLYYNMFLEKNHVSPFFYLQSIINRQLLPIFSLLLLFGLIFHFRKNKYFLPILVFILLIFFSISGNKQDRFILPVFPYIAIIISGFILSLSKFRTASVIILALFSFVQFFIISYGNFLPILHNPLGKFLLSLQKEGISQSGLFSITDEGDWQVPSKEIIKIIYDNARENIMNRLTRVLLIVQNWRINTALDYLLAIRELPIEPQRVSTDSNFLIRSPGKDIRRDFGNFIIESDFIIKEDISPKNMSIHAKHLSKAFEQNFDRFDFIGTMQFPNNLSCRIYKNKRPIKDCMNWGCLKEVIF